MTKVMCGIDCLLKDQMHLLKGKRVGLLAHAASLTNDLRWTVQVFHESPDINLVKLFAPEHGLFGVAQDMEHVGDEIEPITGLAIKSLYGKSLETLTPSEQDLQGIDVFVCDLQDVGTRFYTYVYTLAFCMQACAKLGIPAVVLDRPNPLGGLVSQGNVLTDLTYRSFVGWYSLPVRHGKTIGELSRLWNETESMNCELTVVPMKGWRREMFFDQTGLVFVNPSPNMPTLNTALVYPGGCLVEATEISEARGTTKPFEWIGMPGADAERLASELNAMQDAGVHYRPYHFKPNYQKHAGKVCQGVELLVTDRNGYDSYASGLKVIQTIARLFPEQFQWRQKPYEFVEDIPAIDLLTGNADFREALHNANFVAEQGSEWLQQRFAFETLAKKHLLY